MKNAVDINDFSLKKSEVKEGLFEINQISETRMTMRKLIVQENRFNSTYAYSRVVKSLFPFKIDLKSGENWLEFKSTVIHDNVFENFAFLYTTVNV